MPYIVCLCVGSCMWVQDHGSKVRILDPLELLGTCEPRGMVLGPVQEAALSCLSGLFSSRVMQSGLYVQGCDSPQVNFCVCSEAWAEASLLRYS